MTAALWIGESMVPLILLFLLGQAQQPNPAFAPIEDVPGLPRVLIIPEDVPRYNVAALAMMRRHGVAINDLYEAVLPRLVELQIPGNVHFKPEGSQFLAGQVAARIRAALAK